MSIPHTPLNSPIRKCKSMSDITSAEANASNLMKWPSLNETTFSKCVPTHPMIRTPDTYTPTHNTDPPPQQILSSEPIYSILRMFYRSEDSKKKRDMPDAPLDRPTKVLRTA